MIETRCLKNVVIFIQTVLSFVLSRKTRQFIFCRKLMKIVHSITRGLSLSQINYFSIRDWSRYPASGVMLNLPQSLGKDLACKITPLLKKFEFSTSDAYYIILFTPVTFHINPVISPRQSLMSVRILSRSVVTFFPEYRVDFLGYDGLVFICF